MFGVRSGSTATTGSEAPNSTTNIDTTTSTSIGLHPDVDKLGETGLITNTTEWQEYVIGFTATADYDRILIVPTSTGVNSGGPNPLDISTFLAIDAVNFGLLTDADTDTDGVIDRLDLDSDNDGISDLIESGQDYTIVDTNNDGVHDGGVDVDGIPVAANGGVTSLDTDGDGIVDRLDLDSDGDLIPDQVEAQPTAGYQSLTNINNASNFGVNDIALFAPADTDQDGTFDFRDADSDGDGITDRNEGFTGAPTGDANNDGIDDAVGASYGDGDGTINTPLGTLADEVAGNTQVGYREFTDTDGDTIGDFEDIDDDNDGILDIIEDTNGQPADALADLDVPAINTGGANTSVTGTMPDGNTFTIERIDPVTGNLVAFRQNSNTVRRHNL